MATKTISLDMGAYRRLRAAKLGDESFSQTIKRLIRPRLDVESYRARPASSPMSKEAMRAVEEHVKTRHARSGRKR